MDEKSQSETTINFIKEDEVVERIQRSSWAVLISGDDKGQVSLFSKGIEELVNIMNMLDRRQWFPGFIDLDGNGKGLAISFKRIGFPPLVDIRPRRAGWEVGRNDWESEEEYLAVAKKYWALCFYEPGALKRTDEVHLTDAELVKAVNKIVTLRRRPELTIEESMGLRNYGGLDVLDFGCGVGVDAVIMAQSGANLTLCDIVQSNLDLARRQLEARGFHVNTFLVERFSDLTRLGSFDVIYAGGSIPVIPQQFIKGIVDELKRHLTREGKFVALTYTDLEPGPGREGPYTAGHSFRGLEELLGPDMKIARNVIFNEGTFRATIAVKSD